MALVSRRYYDVFKASINGDLERRKKEKENII